VLVQFCVKPGAQRVQPFHLVDELVAVGGLPVGKIGADHAHPLHRAGDHTGHVILKARDVAHHIARALPAQQGHAVVGFLAKKINLVARRFNGLARKLVIGGFGLLQNQGIDGLLGSLLLQPVQHLRQAHRQRVDVPGGEFHASTVSARNLV
jgi:hypothetical protein